MTIPDAAIKAAAEAIDEVAWNTYTAADFDPAGVARAAIEAALPAIREALAQEIEAEKQVTEHLRGLEALDTAARIVRGGNS